MIVVADSSPLVVLVNIEQISLLSALFGVVTIPPVVAAELASHRRPQAVRDFIMKPPEWLTVRKPTILEALPDLDAGEREAISLACELHADLLLIDERRGRQAASERKLAITGTVGVLELAARRSMVDLADAFERLKKTDFWLNPEFLDERLRLFRSRQGS